MIYVLSIGFLPYALELSFIFIGLSIQSQSSIYFHPQHNPLGVPHSWEGYIYSPPMRYGDS